ncbi:MAG: alpha-L-glutamate ligase [Epsilonproteobacteria bacterium]|nr:alpha-L-glutamate ligase [Campylobacterota bacterium]|tara:strand:- start:11387 stop:12301 length:915 start_codon:yes stop_codon:yes gene_type:complete
MKGWILYHTDVDKLVQPDDYSVLRLLEAAKQKNIDLTIVTPERFELVVTRHDRKSILLDHKPHPLPDFIIPRIGAETTYFGFSILRQLEYLGVYVCNSPQAIETVGDKLHSQQILCQSNLPTPKTMLVKFPVDIHLIKKEFGFPVVVKQISGSKGKGVYLCNNEEDVINLMSDIQHKTPHANIIFQEYISASHGKDIRVVLIGGKIVGCMKRVAKAGDFKANFSQGGQVEKYDMTPELEMLALEINRLFNLDIIGIDFLLDKDGYQICEANSSPGFNGLERIVGIGVAEQMLDYIAVKLGKSTS